MRLDRFPLVPWAVMTSSFRPPNRPNHNGTDWGSPNPATRSIYRTPVYAPFAGDLTTNPAGGPNDGGAGNNVWVIDTNGGRWFSCFHLDTFARPAGPVAAGELVGWVGNTGASQGAHAHIELREHQGGAWVLIDSGPPLTAARDTTNPPPPPPAEETPTVTPEQLATLGQWMQDQTTWVRVAILTAAVNTVQLVNEHTDLTADQITERITNALPPIPAPQLDDTGRG